MQAMEPISEIDVTGFLEAVVLAPRRRNRHCADVSLHRRRRREENYDLQHIAHVL